MTFVKNFTDVDDKIIKRSLEEGISTQEVAEKYITAHNEDMGQLGIRSADIEPKATEHIKDMLHMIKDLLKKGYAYEAGGDIYFRVKNFGDYGKLSHQSLKMMESGARVSPGENKEDPLDFALWKRSKEEEPSWKSGSVEGRPGWHIECSAMSMKPLGDNFDIHGGGIDLIFPHHENEIAQSESYSEKGFANYWMHNGLLTINGQKMAKSLGNYLSISDFLNRYKDADILKLFFLSAHYRSPIDFTKENINAAKAAKERFSIFFTKAEELISKKPIPKATCLKHEHREVLETLKKDFERAMDDDFNTPSALAALFNTVTKGNSIINSEEGNVDEKAIFSNALLECIRELGGVLGLSFSKVAVSNEFKKMVEDLLEERSKAREKKDYKTADRIRTELIALGVIVEDTDAGTKWRLR